MGPRHLVFFAISILFSLRSLAQQPEIKDEWDVPWVFVGDSTYIGDNSLKVIITGKVKNAVTQEPISGASVSLDYFQYYDYTDKQGAFLLEVPPGKYKLRVKHVGLIPYNRRLHLVSDGAFNIEMTEGVVELTEVVISARPIDSNVKESLAGLTKMNIQEIKTLPTLMGEVDIIKSLQLMPGVTTVGEGSSGLNVRGGKSDQNLVLFNDVPLFNSSHALGFVSAFNQDVIKDFTLYKGNVPAQHGGRASSVLDINSRRGDAERWRFQGGFGPISSRLTVEGPVSKTGSILAAGRASHANWFMKQVSDPDVSKSKLSFYDVFGGYTQKFSANSSADVTLYGSRDLFQFSDQFGYDWNNQIVNARWQSLANRKASPTLNVSYGHFETRLFDPSGIDAEEITNTMNYLQLKQMVHYVPNDKHTVTGGVSMISYMPGLEKRRGYEGNAAIEEKVVAKSRGTELAIYLNDDFHLADDISISAGIRYSYFLQTGPDTIFNYAAGVPVTKSGIIGYDVYKKGEVIQQFGGLEPRISARFNLTENQSIKIAYNRMRQYIHLISNTTAPTPVDIWHVANEYMPPQVADNYSAGYFRNIKDNRWETSIEFFYKKMKDLVEYKDFASLFVNPHLETELLNADGKSFGSELYIRRLKGKLTGWISYTYSQTEVKTNSPFSEELVNSGNWYPSSYNKPHNFNFVLNRSLRSASALSVIMTYASGRPFTAIEGSYLVNGVVIPSYSDRNKYNIPDYARVDVSVTIGNIFPKVEDSLVLSIYNLMGRENAYSVFYQRPKDSFFIPKAYKLSVLGAALPSITYNIKF